MKYICVFLSASDIPDKYVKPAEELGKLLVNNGFGLVYGGSDTGLMKVMSSSVQKAGGKVVGITTEFFKEHRKLDADEMIITKDLRERKDLMNKRSDAVVVLAGGIGTLDEITDLLELKKHNLYLKPIIFLNTDNFFTGFKAQLERMEGEGFLPKKLDDMAQFAESPAEVIKILGSTLLG